MDRCDGRMVLESYRHLLDVYFDPIASRFKDTHPNVFSVWSMVFAIAAGISYALSGVFVPGSKSHAYPFLLMVGLLFVILNSIADTLDGRIARMHGKSSKLGDFLDHTMDRLSDVAILAGIAISSYCNTIFGLVSVISVLLASYMGTQSQAVGAGRNYRGIMGRADRMVLLMILTPLQFIISVVWGVKGWDPFGLLGHEITPLELLLAVMLMGGALTFAQRWMETFRELSEKDDPYDDRVSRRRGGTNGKRGRIKRSPPLH